MAKREKIFLTIFAAVIVLAIGLNLYDVPSKKIPHVTMISPYEIRNVDSLYDFEKKRIDNIKVTTWTNHTYIMRRDEAGIHVRIQNEDNELLSETTCGNFLIHYVPESWSPEQVQLQSCNPGDETYTLGSID